MSDMPTKETNYKKLVGGRLAAVRDYLEYKSDRALAKDLNIPEDRLHKWLKGAALAQPLVTDWLAEEHGLNLNYLYSSDPKRLTPEFFPVKRKVRA